MRLLNRLTAALLAAAFAVSCTVSCFAQALPTLPGNSVVGRLSTSTGPAEAIPIGTLSSVMALAGTSTTSLTIGSGSQTLTTQTTLPIVPGQLVLVSSTASTTNYMAGPVTAYNQGTGSLTFNASSTSGSGTFSAWTIVSSGPIGATGATGAAGGIPICAGGGTVSAITCNATGVTLTDQQQIMVVSAGANTSATPTFAPNSLTAHTITARGGAALAANDIGPAGFVSLLEYNLANTRWEMLNPVAASPAATQNNTFTYLSSVAGTNTITATAAPTPSAYAAGQIFYLIPANTTTGAATLNVSSLGAKNIFAGGVATVVGELIAGVPYALLYDGTQFNILNVGASVITWTPVLTFGTPGDLAVTYSAQTGFAIKTGRQITVWFTVITSGFTFTTASGSLKITGSPYTTGGTGPQNFVGSCIWNGITKASYTAVVPTLGISSNIITFVASGSAQTATTVVAADTPSGGTINIQCSLTFFQ